MAEMAKKLHFLKNGTEQTAKAYSTTDEAGSSYITNVIDNTTCYIPIGSVSDTMATNGRVIKTLYVKKVMVDEVWKQPVLSANGTMGGAEFACSVSAYSLVTSGTVADAYGAFDNNTSTYWRSGTTSGWIQFYNPVPLKVSAIKWGFFYCHPTGGNVQGSNDGTTWTTLNTWTNSSEADFTINLSTQQYYKYYRINITGVNKDVIHAHSLTITATYQKEVETYVGEHDDYDYSITDTYAIKSQAKPAYAEQSWTTPGTYTWTAPAGVTRVRVAVCGGGGGASNCVHYPRAGKGEDGGSSSFGSISASGGIGGGTYIGDGDNYYAYTPGTGGTPNGANGIAYNYTYGNGGNYGITANYMYFPSSTRYGFNLSFTASAASGGTYGARGYLEIWHKSTGGSQVVRGATGGTGGYNSTYVNVTPGTTYTVVVGAGGAGKGYYNTYNKIVEGHAGNPGFVFIAYGGDI